jgi:hypothetical protein
MAMNNPRSGWGRPASLDELLLEIYGAEILANFGQTGAANRLRLQQRIDGAEPGDELWAWRHDVGFGGSAGMALKRDGKVIWRECLARY